MTTYVHVCIHVVQRAYFPVSTLRRIGKKNERDKSVKELELVYTVHIVQYIFHLYNMVL